MDNFNILVFDVNSTTDDDSQVNKLNELLKLFDGKAELRHERERTHLVISYDDEKVKKWTSRNAGRKENYYGLKVEEIRKMIDSIGSVAAAEKLGMTKSGMYKRLNKCKNNGDIYF